MKDHGISLNRRCPCTQRDCPIRGNCALCVQNHLEHRRHIPECIQDILRPLVQGLADQVELKTAEARPDPKFWAEFDTAGFLEESLGRHRKK